MHQRIYRHLQDNFTAFLKELIEKNDKLCDKYHEIFDLDIMEEKEYAEDVEGFKSAVLKKDCDVIRKTLQAVQKHRKTGGQNSMPVRAWRSMIPFTI